MRLSRLRQDSPASLFREALWRAKRWGRQRAFHASLAGAACPVKFEPIAWDRSSRNAHPSAITAYADAVLRGEFPLLGYQSPRLGIPPDWHCDWVSGKSWPHSPSPSIQIVRHDGSDVKAPWELSRLQWAPVVARAWRLTGEKKYRQCVCSLLSDWLRNNPVAMGVHWTVAMEAALRAISLCLTLESLWPCSPEEQPWLDRITASLWQHLRFIEAHSEFSFLVRSNHYLANIVGLTTLSAYLRGPGMERRLEKYGRAVQREILLQTYFDGGDREASTGYHVLKAQMFLHSLQVQRRRGLAIDAAFELRLQKMFLWMALLADSKWELPHLGDCDNGRVELLREDIEQALLPPSARHSLRVHSLWREGADLLHIPEPVPKAVEISPASGIAVFRSANASVVFCAMPNGLEGKGSHTHCDKLSLVLRLGELELFCDPGSRGYTRSAEIRNADRSTAAHNTLTIDGADQNILNHALDCLFRSGNEASVSAMTRSQDGVEAAHYGYKRFGIVHRRAVALAENSLLVRDSVTGAGEHMLDVRWIVGPEWHVIPEISQGTIIRCRLQADARIVLLECSAGSELTLTITERSVSREYGAALPGQCLSIRTLALLPRSLETKVTWH
jgi:hypothetical protein